MKILSVILFALFLAFPASANPIHEVKGGFVDWCQGFTDEKEEARCIHGEFAFDIWGNVLEDFDGPGPDDGEDD